jgi:hypothetical protein
MASPQVIVATTTSSQTSAVASTKVRVTANAEVRFTVGSNPTVTTGNGEVIAANTTRYINMQGLNNKLAFITTTGVAGVSVQQIGTVYASSIPGATYIQS